VVWEGGSGKAAARCRFGVPLLLLRGGYCGAAVAASADKVGDAPARRRGGLTSRLLCGFFVWNLAHEDQFY